MFALWKTITNERSPRRGGVALVEMRDRPGGGGGGDSPKTPASKAETVWGRPSSLTVKSAWVRPSTGLPWRSRTTTSTFTTSTPEGNAVDAWAVAAGWGRASPSGAPAGATARASSAGVRTFVRTRGSPRRKTGAGLLPPPKVYDLRRLGGYHSNRAPTRTARGAWKDGVEELPPFTGRPRFGLNVWKPRSR